MSNRIVAEEMVEGKHPGLDDVNKWLRVWQDDYTREKPNIRMTLEMQRRATWCSIVEGIEIILVLFCRVSVTHFIL